MAEKPKIIVIVGPTASGKSDLAVALAKRFGGEVVSADSRQVYMGLDIGTGKITEHEMEGIPHHLLSVVSPEVIFSVSEYRTRAEKAIQDIIGRKKTPIICGGTGFYVNALVDGMVLPDVPPNPELRKTLEHLTAPALYEKLLALDPDFAEVIDKKNPHRLIRAIEIASALGSMPPLARESPYDPCFIGITTEMQTLRQRIHVRLLARIEGGMIDEAKQLHERGLTWERMETLGLEYRYLARHLQGLLGEDKMVSELESEIVRYAKRQMTWFKRDKRIHWFTKDDTAQIAEVVQKHLLPSSTT